MASPTIIDVPHRLGRDEARRRIRARIGELPAHLPGGVADIRSTWTGDYRMDLEVRAMGQAVAATLDVEDRVVRVALNLPPMLSFFSGAITAAVQRKAGKLLLGDEGGLS